MNKGFGFVFVGAGMLAFSAQADVQTVVDVGTSIIKNTGIGAYDTVKPLYAAGSLALNHTVAAFNDWKNDVLAVYNAENASGTQQSIVDTSAYVGGSVLTVSALLYFLYAMKVSKWLKIPLSLLLVPSGVPAFVAVRDLIKQL